MTSLAQYARVAAHVARSLQAPEPHYAGHIMASLRRAVSGREVTIDNCQQNGLDGLQQARVRLAGDPRTYRLILAPDDAPVTYRGAPVGDAFALPLGGMQDD